MKRSLLASLVLGLILTPIGAHSEVEATNAPLLQQSQPVNNERTKCLARCEDIYQLDRMSCREASIAMPSFGDYAGCMLDAVSNASRCDRACPGGDHNPVHQDEVGP